MALISTIIGGLFGLFAFLAAFFVLGASIPASLAVYAFFAFLVVCAGMFAAALSPAHC
ncbi:MAG: hypothetical protein AB8B47_03900 [Roseobacter sp.]